MTKLENEIQEAFKKDHINLTSDDILKDVSPSFVCKKGKTSFKVNASFVGAAFAAASIVLCLPLLSALNYHESIEDSIENRDFASHVVGALGFSTFASRFTQDTQSLQLEELKNKAIPPIAFLNYTYTNKDKIDYSFIQEKAEIRNEIFKVKETITDRFLDIKYDVFLKKANQKALEGCVFINKDETLDLKEPSFFIDINSKENNRDCFLDLKFRSTNENLDHIVFNLKENYDSSIEFTLLNNDIDLFKCTLEHKGTYNLFTLKLSNLDENIIFKIYNKNNMNYDCEYSPADDPDNITSFPYTFNNDGSIDEKNF